MMRSSSGLGDRGGGAASPDSSDSSTSTPHTVYTDIAGGGGGGSAGGPEPPASVPALIEPLDDYDLGSSQQNPAAAANRRSSSTSPDSLIDAEYGRPYSGSGNGRNHHHHHHHHHHPNETDAMDESDLGTVDRPIATTEALLDEVGLYNVYSALTVYAMAFIWGLTAMPIMVSAYTTSQYNCSVDDVNCTPIVTIQEEFNLPTHGIYSVEWFASMYFVGNLIANQIPCILSDRIGRLPVVAAGVLGTGVFGVLGALAPSYGVLLASRLFQGMFFTASSMVNWVLASESVSIREHPHASLLFGMFYVLGYCAVCPIALLFPHWRYVMWAISLPSLVFAGAIYFWLPESISYLILKKRTDEVHDWLRNVNRWRRAPVRVDMPKLLAENGDSGQRMDSVKRLLTAFLRRKRLVLFLFISLYHWTSDYLVYNGLSLAATALSVGNTHWNYILSALVEIPSYVVTAHMLNRFGRKPTSIFMHGMTGASLVAFAFLEEGTAYRVFWFVAKFGACSAFMCIYVYTAELFPIEFRNLAMGACSAISNIGAILAPHANVLPASFVLVLFGILSTVSAIFTVFLPETLNVKH